MSHPIQRRTFLLVAFAAVLGLTGISALPSQAEPTQFPNQSLRLVVPYPPGGTADILARDVAAGLAKELGQPVVIENRAGAGTAIGARHVAGSAADGYTLFLGTSTSHVMNPAVNPQGVGYDPVADFTPLAAIGEVPYVIVTKPDSGIASLEELVRRAASSTHPLTYASAGMGSANHLAGELLANLEKVSFTHVPYKGSAPALNDVLAGQVDFMFDLATTAQAHVRSGRLVPLSITAGQRSETLPDVPTTAEGGLPELALTSWFGVFAPAATSPEVAEKLSSALKTVLSDEQVRLRLRSQGLQALTLIGNDFAAFIKRDLGYWQGVVRAANVTLNG